MKLTFKLRFHTKYGQSLRLVGNHAMLGNGQVERAIPLHYLNEEFWQATIYLDRGAVPDAEITYNYILRETDGFIIQDRGNGRTINPASFAQEELLIIDAWNPEGQFENAFHTEPFQQVLLKESHTGMRVPAPHFASASVRITAAMSPLTFASARLCAAASASKSLPDTGSVTSV